MTTDPIYQKLVSAHVAISEAIEMLEVKQSTSLPDSFITMIPERRIRRYTRCSQDSWNVHQWDERWKFYDNVSEATAKEAFDSATFVASEVFRK